MNMAIDEALLEAADRLGHPVLRTYAWTETAATFGYFQRYTEVARLAGHQRLIRRPTGGGLVPHEMDWTYSIVVPPGHAWFELNAVESYRTVHQWLQASFAHLGHPTELAPCCVPRGPGQCFVGAEKYDLLSSGLKIAGAAQRRNRYGLLIQGSVQPPPANLLRVDWEQSMGEVASVLWEPLMEDPSISPRAVLLAAEKYAAESYNRKR
jgi:lipoyl(octanoyl) transferase